VKTGKHIPAAVLVALRREFAAGLPARIAILREALDELERGASTNAAQRLRLTAHSLAGTSATLGATELTPHAERLESLGRDWQENGGRSPRDLAEARRALEQLATAGHSVAARLQSGDAQ
jgi:HPt (histidine-containing phosphotransfer) domain-containing protein